MSDPGPMDLLVSVCEGRREDQNNNESVPSSAQQRTAFGLQADDCTTLIFLNSFVLLEHLALLLTSTLAINC